jgi:hypothetical protein
VVQLPAKFTIRIFRAWSKRFLFLISLVAGRITDGERNDAGSEHAVVAGESS